MNVQFKKGALALCVLAIVSKRDCYGYELTEKISQQIDISEGSIYPLLRRLTKEAYFTTYLVESSGGPSRKYYRLTEKGKDYLEEMRSQWLSFAKGVNQLLEEE
ncbi:MAG: PadR family transcriptional regulator [Defluviitaleaceae bacterium]|nr:PadR family transcriptional regulator [Defluviitaleaceae bacterium]